MNGKTILSIFCIFILSIWLAGKASSQDHADAAAQANNPLANMTAFNLQNYYIGELTESKSIL